MNAFIVVPWLAALSGRRLALLVLTALLITTPAFADSMYVTDILRLGLHASSDTSDQPFRMLASGDELEILERSRYYAQVRTANGDVGWVKASYLIDEKPAQARLTELTRERDRLASELATLSDRLSDNSNELESLRSEREGMEQNAAAVAKELDRLSTDNEKLTAKVAAYRYSVPMLWVFGIGVLTIVGGFLGGWWWADAKQRQRHGGFRI